MLINRRRIIYRAGAVFWTFVVALAALGAPQQKEPWNWKPEERAALRLNAEARRSRLAEYKAKLSSRPGSANFRCDDVIDGSVHPELLFPAQLFRDLVSSAFVRLPAASENIARAYSSDLFRGPGEWSEFLDLARPYGDLLKREEVLLSGRQLATRAQTDPEKSLDDLRREQDDAAVTALQACRKAFGTTRFDRALYEIIGRSTVECFSDTKGDGGSAATRALLDQDRRSNKQ